MIFRKFFFLLLFPVMAVAQEPVTNYYTIGEGLVVTTKGDDNGYKFKLSGMVQPSYEARFYTDPLVPDMYSRFRMRRFRIRIAGDIPVYKMEYGMQLDLSGTSETGDETKSILMDAWVAYNFSRNLQLTFGQRSTATDNRELMLGSQSLQLAERSRLTTAFGSIREFGLFLDGTFRFGKTNYIRPYFNVTNGDGINVMANDHGGIKVGGRIDYLPFGLFTNLGQFREADVVRELTPKLVAGVNLSYNKGVSSRNGKESGTILYLDAQSNELLPDFGKYGADFMFKYRGFSMIGEFVGSWAVVPENITQRVRTDGSVSTVFEVNGVHDVSNYVKERMILGKAWNLQAGYIFKNRISVDARYTFIDADEHSFLNNGTFYNRPNYYTLGLTKYFTRGYGFKVQTSVTYCTPKSGSNLHTGVPLNGNELTFNFLTSYAF